MKKISVLLVFCFIIMPFSACQSSQDILYSQAVSQGKAQMAAAPSVDPNDPDYLGDPTAPPGAVFTPAPEDDLSGELTIKLYLWYPVGFSVNLLANEFMKLHPNVTITFDYGLNVMERSGMSKEERAVDRDQFYTALRMELASGEADYLLFGVSDDLDLDAMTRNNIFYDMSSYWENDYEIRETDYFMPVLETCKIDGKMTVIPYGFSFPAVTFPQRVVDEIGIDLTETEAVSVTQLLDWYDLARQKKPELNLFFTSPGKDVLFSTERVDYMDLDNHTCDFVNSDFVNFLKRTDGVMNEDPALEGLEIGAQDPGLARYWEEYFDTGKLPYEIWESTDAGFPKNENVVKKANEWFVTGSTETASTFYTLQDPLPYLTRPYPLVSSKGKLGITVSDAFSVPSSLKNKDLAWEFIKYCLSNRADPSFYELTGFRWVYVDSIPVNRNNCQKMAEYVATGNAYGGSLLGYPGNYKGIDPDMLMAELDKILSYNPVYADAYNVDVQEYLDEFYVNDLITPEQCAEKIQGRATIWLNE